MRNRPWFLGYAINLGTPEEDWILKGIELLKNASAEHLTYSAQKQILLDNPEWAFEYDPERRNLLAMASRSALVLAREKRVQLPRLLPPLFDKDFDKNKDGD